jgi:hypothetical protein
LEIALYKTFGAFITVFFAGVVYTTLLRFQPQFFSVSVMGTVWRIFSHLLTWIPTFFISLGSNLSAHLLAGVEADFEAQVSQAMIVTILSVPFGVILVKVTRRKKTEKE